MLSRNLDAVSSVCGRRQSWVLPGTYRETAFGTFADCPILVDAYYAKAKRHSTPVLVIPGAGFSGAFWIRTPDDREGWAHSLLGEGFDVYLVSQPLGAVSTDILSSGPSVTTLSAEVYERLFTAPKDFENTWPQAVRHTRWPGSGRRGDPVFDALFAAQLPFVEDTATAERGFRGAAGRLLDAIGPVVLLTHSRGGCLGWALADERPGMVSAIVAVEPNGPPVADFFKGLSQLPWGITNTAMSFDPPATHPDELAWRRKPEDKGAPSRFWVYDGPPRRLSALEGIPVLLVTAEASYHAAFDHCTVGFLRQMGVTVEHCRLEGQGITGNGHLMMLETNRRDIIALLSKWMASNTV